MPAVWSAVILRSSASSYHDSDVIKIHFFHLFWEWILQVASQHQYAILIATGKDEKERMTAISQMVYGRRVDGSIFSFYAEETILWFDAYEEQFLPYPRKSFSLFYSIGW